jgi:hypothetical protein
VVRDVMLGGEVLLEVRDGGEHEKDITSTPTPAPRRADSPGMGNRVSG